MDRYRRCVQLSGKWVSTYWQIGRHIVEFEQGGNTKSEYGSKLINRLSKDLSDQLGRGFSRSNLIYMRLLYQEYPESQVLSDQLTWGHYVELISIDHDVERSFYERQAGKVTMDDPGTQTAEKQRAIFTIGQQSGQRRAAKIS